MPIETYQENALKLKHDLVLGAVTLFAPAFLTLEVTNALWRAVKLKRLSEENSQKALKTLDDTKISLYELDWPEASQVLELALELDIAIYDAAYVFLSDKMNSPLVTSDTKLHEKTKSQFQILHLKDYV